MVPTEKVNVCSKNCVNCRYFQKLYDYCHCCNYFLATGERRPCPAGDGCTVKVTKSEYRKMMSRLIAVQTDKAKERNRRKAHAYYERHKDEINAKAKEKRLAKQEAKTCV